MAVDDFHCSFCGKRRQEVLKLISGPRVFICNECTALCVDAIEKEKAVTSSGPRSETEGGKSEAKEAKLHCSFCGKSQRQVEVLVAGRTFYICDECVGLCVDIIEEEKEKGQSQPPGSGSSA